LSAHEPEKPFEAPWQAEAFAMVIDLHAAGLFTWGDWTMYLGAALDEAPERPYYESWLLALERLVEDMDLMTAGERKDRIAAWDRAARATPHGQPILLENADKA
jgi:nitrile hydratase accessory protein